MHRSTRHAVWAAIAIGLAMPPASALAAAHPIELAQNAPEVDRAAAEPAQPAALPANTPEQIRRAQVELKRLDCLAGRVDGKLGNATRQAIRKFWASAKQPDADLNVTDELIAALAERGDNFCRPARPFFAIGGRAGGKAVVPFFAPGAKPALPGAPAPPVPSAAEH
jgi:peptidoglycan hydrolase-like protein with peptidoglycan-binding domain